MSEHEVRIKFYLGKEVRLVTMENKPSPAEISRVVFAKFGVEAKLDKYEDHDGDKVTIEDDNDLDEAFNIYYSLKQSRPKLLHTLKLFLQELPSSTSASTLLSSSSGGVSPHLISNPNITASTNNLANSASEIMTMSTNSTQMIRKNSTANVEVIRTSSGNVTNEDILDYTSYLRCHSPITIRPPSPPNTPPISYVEYLNGSFSGGESISSVTTSGQSPVFLNQLHSSSGGTPSEYNIRSRSLSSPSPPSLLTMSGVDYMKSHYQGAITASPQLNSSGVNPNPKLPNNMYTSLRQSLAGRTRSNSISESVTWKKGQLLGNGGFGSVYLGLLETGEIIAVKQIEFADCSNDPSFETKLQEAKKEIQIMKSLQHQHIVQYLGSQTQGNVISIFLEYVSGGSIRKLLSTFGPLNESIVRVYTRQILLGLEYLHANRAIHRDIKGANILVDTCGSIKLADFGCSKIYEEVVSHTGNNKSVKGTPNWMAPEVIRGTGYGRTADIWSVGCTIIEMLTARPPFSQFTEATAAMFHIGTTQEPPPFPENISDDCKDFLLKCFVRDPLLRPDATQLLAHPFASTTLQIAGENQFLEQIATVESIKTPMLVQLSIMFLPDDITRQIFRFLPLDSLITVSAVCRHWRIISSGNQLWKPMCLSSWAEQSSSGSIDNTTLLRDFPEVDTSWRKLYFNHRERIALYQCSSNNNNNNNSNSNSNSNSSSIGPKLMKQSKLQKKQPVMHPLIATDETIFCSTDKRLRIWNTKSKTKKLKSITAHSAPITGLCLLQQQQQLLSASEDKTIKQWDVSTRKCTNVLVRAEVPVTSLTVSLPPMPSSLEPQYQHDHHNPIPMVIGGSVSQTKVAYGCLDGSIRVYVIDSSEEKVLTEKGATPVTHLVFCNDNLNLVSISDDEHNLKVWNVEQLECSGMLVGHSDAVLCCSISDLLQQVISTSLDGTIRYWDPCKQLCTAVLDVGQPVLCLDSNEDVLVGGLACGTVVAWDLFTLVELCRFEVQPATAITCLKLLNGDCVLCAGAKFIKLFKW